MDLNGIYRGFSPTDESDVGLGELELVITDSVVSYRFATGLKIWGNQVPRAELHELSPSEGAAYFKHDTDTTSVTFYELGENGPIFLMFAEFPEGPQEARVAILRFVSDDIDSMFGPTYLFTPEQVEAGYFDQTVARIEVKLDDPGVIPRLANNGLRG